ncbi:DNA replication licensing factor mcm5-A-like [Oopsacas minuta]|uniref:DNA replication licensing factor MCM5 n=1 Tax=Oopsacas minuta TaxID=111878 RepID=A0AAV7K9W6_9METZ|nr:DNA replication licensing factor mcm5-A-like [Oopsacas minuta]
MADELTSPRPLEEAQMEQVQVTLSWQSNPLQIRQLKSVHMSRLVRVPGIVVSCSSLRAKATSITIRCRGCNNTTPNIAMKPGFDGYSLPRTCSFNAVSGRDKCPIDPFIILPEKCKCVDFQVLKLQESPDAVPTGEMPRHMQAFCERYMTERVVPGNKVTLLAIFSIRRLAGSGQRGQQMGVGLRKPYLRVVGVDVSSERSGQNRGSAFTPQEEEKFRILSAHPDVYDMISRSIAPSIFGSTDIKRAIACQLFGGSRKRMPDGLTRRGDINLLLLGDPGTAKSQLLKFVEKVSPVAVYTSGKGSSAAGLTASVIRDPSSRGFVIEGGAMVLADGGIVCIDEFDKMREDDRVAIHEAMEQQTISIAKAGITTTLNSRCAVLAAANSVFGRWDDTKGAANIDFMPTILSRFDMIFIVKDVHDLNKDIRMAKHVMKVHLNAVMTDETVEGELPLETLKRFISFAKQRCGPRLSKVGGDKLAYRYVMMRGGTRDQERRTERRSAIPITVRQLEAVIRISESLAKMSMLPFATETHVDEALRLFQVSTLEAASSGTLSGVEGFSSESDQDEIRRVEAQLKSRFPIGSQVSEQRIIQDFVRQKYSERSIETVLSVMLRRGELQHRMQRKVLFRVR